MRAVEAVDEPVGGESKGLSTREKILERALILFAERGFEAVSVRDICASIGVNHGLIKYYFGDKESLWKAAVSRMFERMWSTLDDDNIRRQDLPPGERMALWIRQWVHYCAHHPEHARLMAHECVAETSRLQWMVDTFVAPLHQEGVGRLEKLIELGHLPDVSPISLFYIISSAAQAPFMLAPEVDRIHGIDMFDEKRVSAHADALVALLLRQPTA
ncbi:TetR/AcrR family transcriptional regulator [Parapedomonas caeni]